MLQQTRVSTVLGYYEKFLRRFPDLPALAQAPLRDVLAHWAGLGYYARARLAHACARQLMEQHAGRFPDSAAQLERLPGIGASTAAAIAAFCHDERAAILDANVKRVLIRRYAIDGDPRQAGVLARLWEHARNLLPGAGQVGRYTQAIMDLGATVCVRSQPRCAICPVATDCQAHLQHRAAQLPTRVAASRRPVRTAHFLVALHRRAVLLEQRPPSGIWGGLFSLPQYASRAALLRAAGALALGRRPRPMALRQHDFTHFQLRFTPYLLHLDGPRPARASSQQQWVALRTIDTAPLPAPTLALLRSVRAELATARGEPPAAQALNAARRDGARAPGPKRQSARRGA